MSDSERMRPVMVGNSSVVLSNSKYELGERVNVKAIVKFVPGERWRVVRGVTPLFHFEGAPIDWEFSL